MNSNDFSNLNITPEMIKNLASMLSNSSNQDNFSGNDTVSSEKSQDEPFSSDSSDNNIDFDTILKMKSAFEAINQKDDPRSNLLYSLKPYLRENRQKKLDQYVNLLKITQVTNLLKNEKGDKK